METSTYTERLPSRRSAMTDPVSFLFFNHLPYRETPTPNHVYQNVFETLHIQVLL